MCIRTNTSPALACTIADLLPFTEYHDINGDVCVVTTLPRDAENTTVANLCTGKVTQVYSSVKLGYDERGRLYTSRYLNDWYAPADEDEEVDLPLTLQAPPK